MLKRGILFFQIFLSYKLISQPTLDTIASCLKQKPQLFVKFDSRNSFISNSRAKVFGIKAGLNYGKRLYLGIGYNQLYPPANNFNKLIYINDNVTQKDSVVGKLNMFYFSGHVEYVFHKTKYWQLSMPLQLGVGKTNYKYEYSGIKKTIEDNYNFIYEPAVSIEYKPIKWVGVGADVGYRFMITSYRRLNEKFNSPTYAFKILIYYSEVVKSLFSNNKLVKKIK